MLDILDRIAKADDFREKIAALHALVKEIRPEVIKLETKKRAVSKFDEFLSIIEQSEAHRLALSDTLISLVSTLDTLSFYTESGIYSGEGFFTEGFSKLTHKFLPKAPEENNLLDNFDSIFHSTTDFVWVNEIPDEKWIRLVNLLFKDKIIPEQQQYRIDKSLGYAIEVLSQRIAGMALEPLMVSRYPSFDDADSPFMTQNRLHINILQQAKNQGRQSVTEEQVRLLNQSIEECDTIIHDIRKGQNDKGASLDLTFKLQRMSQHTTRIKLLTKILFSDNQGERFSYLVRLFKYTIESENKKNSLREHFLSNIGHLAFQVTEHAGRTGEHYITYTAKEYFKMLYSSMKGGFIVGFLTIFKVLAYYLHLSPFGTAFLYSLNYSLGFIAIHITHSTLATKQPAMTANKIAASLDIKEDEKESVQNLAGLIVNVFRSQFVAFMGNIFIAFPTAFFVAMGWYYLTDGDIATVEKAHHMIDELHPWKSLSLFHAGIAGVCLFAAGVISGYFDNKVVYGKIPQRMMNQPFLKRMLKPEKLERFSVYIKNNLGSLSGNFFLGIFLGSIGTFGDFVGLPLDIRHITFASGNFGMAMASIGSTVDAYTIFITVVGIFGIGVMNFIVSFGLATYVAIQSRRVSFKNSRLLLFFVGKRFLKNPLVFFFPPKGGNSPHKH